MLPELPKYICHYCGKSGEGVGWGSIEVEVIGGRNVYVWCGECNPTMVSRGESAMPPLSEQYDAIVGITIAGNKNITGEVEQLEGDKQAYRTALAMLMHRFLHEADTNIWEMCHQQAWLSRADKYVKACIEDMRYVMERERRGKRAKLEE